jgi:hypothetical protein
MEHLQIFLRRRACDNCSTRKEKAIQRIPESDYLSRGGKLSDPEKVSSGLSGAAL